MSQTFDVKFWNQETESYEYIGPFDTLEDAEDYADYNNTGLSYGGHPALYSVAWIMINLCIFLYFAGFAMFGATAYCLRDDKPEEFNRRGY